jgi:hypothetical protein
MASEKELRQKLDAAGARMDHHANRCIERLIRRGFVDRSDVEELRAIDKECRELLERIERAAHDQTQSGAVAP